MATPKVTLKSKQTGGVQVFYLDYRINGKRHRPKVGTNRKDAELVRAKVEREILLGTYQITTSQRSVSLSALVEEFLDSKKHVVRKTSSHRYRNYLEPLTKYFDKAFPSVTSDIRIIEAKYLRVLKAPERNFVSYITGEDHTRSTSLSG
jgi:hypothetical protein